jgi:large conductance mechanosensitive channel
MLKEFRDFAMRGNVIDLAVGVIIGGAFGKIVSSFVSDVLMPPIGMLVGNMDFSELKIILKQGSDATKPVAINIGTFLNTTIDFLIVAFCIFMVVKGMNSLKKQPPAPAPTEKKCPECQMMVPLTARKCGHCTSTLANG